MKKKKLVTLIVILIIIVVGFVYFRQGGDVPGAEQAATGTEGTVDADGFSEEDVLDQIIADIESQELLDVDEAFRGVDEALNAL